MLSPDALTKKQSSRCRRMDRLRVGFLAKSLSSLEIPRIVNALVQEQGRTRWVCGPGFAPAVVIGALMRSTVQEWGPRGELSICFSTAPEPTVSTQHTTLSCRPSRLPDLQLSVAV